MPDVWVRFEIDEEMAAWLRERELAVEEFARKAVAERFEGEVRREAVGGARRRRPARQPVSAYSGVYR